jgi:hypothetical protein
MTDSRSEFVAWLYRDHEESQRLDAAAMEHNRLLAALAVKAEEREVQELRQRLQGQTRVVPSKSQAAPHFGQRAELPALQSGISEDQIQLLASEMGVAIKDMGEVIAEALKNQPAPEVSVNVQLPKKQSSKVVRGPNGLITGVEQVDSAE